MRKTILYLLILICSIDATAINPVQMLVKRRLPGYENQFIFKIDSLSDVSFFQIQSVKKKIEISGNSYVNVASGLNWYLKYYCHASFSQCGNQTKMPEKLPEVKVPVRKETSLSHSFYLNYCTFSYSMPFWSWEQWEEEIDRMALNGVTTPMAMVGVECVWRNTLRRLDFTESEISAFIPGPAYQGWFLMGNLDGMGGPLPEEWYERQYKLQKRILTRMNEYGMKPVFQAFFGMVPSIMSEKYPEADIIGQGKWLSFNRPPVLNPNDPLFRNIAQVWYEEYEKLFGTAEYYAGDLFHEGGKKDNIDVAEAGKSVQDVLLEFVPESSWIIQSWGGNPSKELLKNLDKSKVLVVDLCAEYWDRWSERNSFEGTPWIWANITNWGGNIGLHGRLNSISREPLRALKESPDYLKGIGCVPEGIGTNPIVFDLANEMRWHTDEFDLKKWIENYSIYRYGKSNDEVKQAWNIFYITAYGTYAGHRRPSESVFCAKPSLKVKSASAWGSAKIHYDISDFKKGLVHFYNSRSHFADSDSYNYDLIDFTRQHVANVGRDVYSRIQQAHKNNQIDSLKILSEKFLNLILIQDSLLSYRREFTVAKWIDEARSCSDKSELQDLYEYNARNLITVWADQNSSLVDYAHREWSGLLKDYYYPRWKMFFESLIQSKNNKEPLVSDFYKMEQSWAESNKSYLSEKMEEPDKLIQHIIDIY